MSHIFISYSRVDEAYARALANTLVRRGFDVWWDNRIVTGDRWWSSIVQAIQECSALIVLMSPSAEDSEWIESEILLAKREQKDIFPLLLSGQEFALLIGVQYSPVGDITEGGLLDLPDEFIARLSETVPAGDQTGVFVEAAESSLPQPVGRWRRYWPWLAAAAAVVVIGVTLVIMLTLPPSGWEMGLTQTTDALATTAGMAQLEPSQTAGGSTLAPTATLNPSPTLTNTLSPSMTATATTAVVPTATPWISIDSVENDSVYGQVGPEAFCHEAYKVTLYAFSFDSWYVQPFDDSRSAIAITPTDCSWQALTHPWQYLGAHLVAATLTPPAEIYVFVDRECPPLDPSDPAVLAGVCGPSAP